MWSGSIAMEMEGRLAFEFWNESKILKQLFTSLDLDGEVDYH